MNWVKPTVHEVIQLWNLCNMNINTKVKYYLRKKAQIQQWYNAQISIS